MKGEREGERYISVKEKQRLAASSTHPDWAWSLQPGYVQWLGMDSVAFWCTQSSGQGTFFFSCDEDF